MSSENCSDAYISDDAKSEYEYESDEDDEFDWAALLDENWDDDQHDDDDEHESDFVDFEEDDERLLDEDVDLGSGGDGSSHEPGDAHAACGGLHSCGGPLHGHLQGLSRHPLLDGGHEADRVPCNAWWQNLCRLCCMYQHAATLKKDRRLASAKDWKRRDALVASRLGLPAPLSAGPEVVCLSLQDFAVADHRSLILCRRSMAFMSCLSLRGRKTRHISQSPSKITS